MQLFLYAAGSSTKQTAAKDNAGAASWSNPIILDSGGNLPSGGVIWFTAGQNYKAVYAPSNDTDPPASPYRTIDNLSGINDITSAVTEWIAGPTPTFVSGSQFTLSGDQTATFTKSRRLKFTVTAGTTYGAISSVSFAANTTTVNVAFASGALDSGLSAVSYSIIDPSNPSVDAEYADKQASSVASSGNGTTNIWGVAGNSLHITGTNTINNFSTAPYTGAIRELVFDGALSLNHNATSLIMPGAANITTAVGDTARVYADGASTRVLGFTRAAFSPAVLSPVTNALSADVALSTVAAYFDGPSLSTGTTGTWWVSGQVVVTDTAAAFTALAKLTDGTNVLATGSASGYSTNANVCVSLSAYIANPAGNLRISARDSSTTNGVMRFNVSGSSTDSRLSAIRIA